MPDFEMLSSEKIEFNNGGEFLELSINVVKDGDRQSPYLRLARGYYSSDGEPRYKKGGCTLPVDRQVLQDLSEALKAWDIAQAEQLKAANAASGGAKKPAGKKARGEEMDE